MRRSRTCRSRRDSAPRPGGSSISPTCSSKPAARPQPRSSRASGRLPDPSSRAFRPRRRKRMPVQEFTFDDIKNILVNRIGLSEAAVVDDPSLSFEQLGLDSLAFVEIQLAMQQEYGFTIPDEDASQIMTIGEGIDYVNRRLQEREE